MEPLSQRDIFLRTLDGFFAPLRGAVRGAIEEVRRASGRIQEGPRNGLVEGDRRSCSMARPKTVARHSPVKSRRS